MIFCFTQPAPAPEQNEPEDDEQVILFVLGDGVAIFFFHRPLKMIWIMYAVCE